jgi:hypothetical protein
LHCWIKRLAAFVNERSLGALLCDPGITLQANHTTTLPVPTLSRDAIDLAMMVHHWGPIPGEAWAKVHGAYGASADRAFQSASQLLSDPAYLGACLSKMAMPPSLASTITHALGIDHNSATP